MSKMKLRNVLINGEERVTMDHSEFIPAMPMKRLDDMEVQRGTRQSKVVTEHQATVQFVNIMQELIDLHRQKGKDYGNDIDPFANVSGSADFGVEPWVAAMVRANDKMRRLQRFAKTGTLANEGVIDSFNDLAVYAVIGRVLYERGKQ
jgi:hypothetical protein